MSKAILMSIHPKQCEMIVYGEKAIVVHKTRPKLDAPFKCYIYCTKEQLLTKSHNDGRIYISPDKKYQGSLERNGNITLSGHVISEFVCDEIIKSTGKYGDELYLKLWDTGAVYEDVKGYARHHKYGWHISDLKIYDEPKLLSDFKPWNRECAYSDLGLAIPKCEKCHECKIEKPPQSWCYVEEVLTE